MDPFAVIRPKLESAVPQDPYDDGDIALEDLRHQNLLEELRRAYPNGHPGFIPLMVQYMALHSRKNGDYARGGNPLGNFQRVANILAQYPGLNMGDPAVVAMVYMMKQLDAYLWMKAQKYDGSVEGKADRLGDVTVYSSIARLIEEERPGDAPADLTAFIHDEKIGGTSSEED